MHYGKFIAEAKFCADSAAYEHLIRAGDADALMALLTFPQQEEHVIARVASKAAIFGQDVGADGRTERASYKVEPDLVAGLYRDWVMPLTKEVQVRLRARGAAACMRAALLVCVLRCLHACCCVQASLLSALVQGAHPRALCRCNTC